MLVATSNHCLTVVLGSKFRVMPLPYSLKGLEPYLSRDTLDLHYNTHYRGHVEMLNAMLRSIQRLKGYSLIGIMRDSYLWNKPLYNHAAQSWNHDFYFKCMTSHYFPPPPSLVQRISREFGSFQRFEVEFRKAGNSALGSGWVWLVHNGVTGKLFITKTIGADNPMVQKEDYRPILVMDVWEHAYYLDYHNRRKDYTEAFVKELVDWRFVEENLQRVEAEAVALAKVREQARIEEEAAKRERERMEAEAIVEAARVERLRKEAEEAAAEAARREQEVLLMDEEPGIDYINDTVTEIEMDTSEAEQPLERHA